MVIFQRGTHVGGHVIVQLLGSGERADVYEVVAVGGRRRALKLLGVDAPLDSKLQARLDQEGAVIATIEHVNVVRFWGIGIHHGRVWLLLELVEGPDLRRLVLENGGTLPVARAVSIVRQGCEGVAAAHALKIIHRDLCPENILVAADDVTKVADFDKAKVGAYGVKTTSEKDLVSWRYTAPEVFHGRAGPRSDVYSMAVILYEILTGENPIVPVPMAMGEMVNRQTHHEPPPLAALGRDFPGDLSALLERAMSKDPARRPDMREFAGALGAVLHRLNVPRRAAARSLPLPNREARLAMTDPMPVFNAGGTMLMAARPAEPAPAVSIAAETGAVASIAAVSSAVRVASPPPAPSVFPVTFRSRSKPPPAPAPAAVTAAMSEVLPAAERASTHVPTVRATARPSAEPRAKGPTLALVGAALALALLGEGWLLFAGGGAVGIAASSPSASAPSASSTMAPVASSSVPAPAPAATSSASAPRPTASAAPARHRAAPQRPTLPFR